MNEEEKKAIEILKEVASDDFDTLGDDISPKMAQNILNLIDKQQKEIEEKNIAINKMSKDISSQLEEIEEKSTIIMAGAEKVKQLKEEIEELKLITRQYNSYCINTDDDDEPRIILAHKHYFDSGVFVSNFISKDKIEEKIEEARKIRWHTPKLVIEYFEELLEEN